MKDLQKLVKECEKELDALGIDYGNISWSINYRAKKRWGLCKTVGKDTFSISISHLLLNDNVSDKATKNTIIHEMLHAADRNRNGHKDNWKNLASKVNRAYGYTIKRTSSSAEKGVELVKTERKQRYKYVCLGCGAKASREKKCDFTKNTNRYLCTKCTGKFVPENVYEELSEQQKKELNRCLKMVSPHPIPYKMYEKIRKMEG